MCGSASDSDDLVQETFVRALERPPSDLDASLRPWLVRVAVNLARDHLRRRKRAPYRGVWLPTPIEGVGDATVEEAIEVADERPSAEARYGLMESASFAFLAALEQLTPSQRAVLLLRDVLDYTVRETEEALEMSAANVRTTLHRARRKMREYDRSRSPPSAESSARIESMLAQVLACFAQNDVARLQSLLAEGVRVLSDGGGVTPAAKEPVVGRERVSTLYANIARRTSPRARIEVRTINGAPALVGEDPDVKPPAAKRFVFRIELDGAGLIREIHSVINPEKLGAIGRMPPS